MLTVRHPTPFHFGCGNGSAGTGTWKQFLPMTTVSHADAVINRWADAAESAR
jgi:hypothetical protein